MVNFITLFDINYIERGLALYNSLFSVCEDFFLYVITFDDECYEKLYNQNFDKIEIIRYSDFEDDTLRIAKLNRNKREFLWTCSSYGIKYIFDKYNVDNITYIDADLYFFSNPTIAINNFLQSDKDVAIISHRYSKNFENKYFERKCGKYCVEFNSFKNTENGKKILNWWCQKCFEKCPDKPSKDSFGDQKYLDYFESNFSGVYVYNDFGLGIAPWNIDDYRIIKHFRVKRVSNNDEGEIVFYHFHSLDLFENYAKLNVYIRPGKKDENLINFLYLTYLKELSKYKLALERTTETQKDYSGLLKWFLDVFLYVFAEKNIIISVRKVYRLLFFRKKDYLKF